MFLLCCSYVALIHEWEGNQVEKKTKQKETTKKAVTETKEYGSNYTLPFGTSHQVGNPNHLDNNLRNSKSFHSDNP